MQVKCLLAQGAQTDMSMMDLLALTRNTGQTSLGGLINDFDKISMVKARSALVLVGGRESISRFFYNSGGMPRIVASRPVQVCFARKHRMFGKNETCLKIVCGGGFRQPPDGSEYINLVIEGDGTQAIINPVELGHILYFAYGWG
jgi:hypothetical protein